MEGKSPMAASGEQSALGQLDHEATCPLCLDFFKQPMVLSCGHNFCHHCLAQLGATFSCPQCRVKSTSVSPNLALANVVGLLKKLQLSQGAQEESNGRRLCQEHREPLQSFCSSEKRLLCPGCLGEHQDHPLLSLPEAAQEYKDLLDGLLEPLRKEGQKLLEQREEEEQSRQQIQEQFAAEKEKVGLALESLQELLREREPVWMAWVAEQEEKMEAEWAVALAQLSGEASRLQQLIGQTERKYRLPDGEFLQEIQDTVERCRNYVVGHIQRVAPKLQERHRTILDKNASVMEIVDNCKASLQKTLTKENLEQPLATAPAPEEPRSKASLEKTLTKENLEQPLAASNLTRPLFVAPLPQGRQTPRSPKVYIELNHSTAHPRLYCGEIRMFWAKEYQELPETPERFDQELCVLGLNGFTTGWKWWEVTVHEADQVPAGGRAFWAIGVAKESVRRKGSVPLSPQEGIWALGKTAMGEIVAFSNIPQKLNSQSVPKPLRVRLHYEAETVEFLDANTETSLYTFQTGPFRGQTLRPFFYVGQKGVTLEYEEDPYDTRHIF